MNIDRTTRLFFDASCLIAAAGSPSGGSGFLLSLCARRLLVAVVSQFVLLEAERNVRAKLGAGALRHYRAILELTPFLLASVPVMSGEEPWMNAVNHKDSHVVAAALASRSHFLLSLDRGLVDEVKRADVSLAALSPGDFIRNVLPSHGAFPE